MPGLRRLRDPRRAAVVHAGARRAAREHRLRLGHRLRGALPVLHGDVRDALDPRPRAGDRDGALGLAAGSLGVGRDRRRRRALDRRQPPDPLAPPQREPEDPALQQPDLRADEGAVLADEPARHDHEVDAARLARPAVQSDLARDRRRGDVRRALDRHGSRAPDGGAARGGEPSRRRVRGDLPELQHLQRRRVRLRARRQDEPHLPRARPADPLRRGRREGRAAAAGRIGRGLRGRRASRSCTTRTWSSRRSRSRCRA